MSTQCEAHFTIIYFFCSFDEDDASSVSSGDISDTLDLVDTQVCTADELNNTDSIFKSDLRSTSTPYRHPSVSSACDSMRDRNGK